MPSTQTVDVGGRKLRISNLDKVLYPAAGFTKAEVIDYYAKVSATLLPHVTGRPLTLKRYPDGVDSESFFEKNVSRHAPDWVRTVQIATPGSSKQAESADFAVVDDMPTLVWVANLASVELHVPQWTVGKQGAERKPDRLVFDLDPGPPATIVECCRVALALREELEADGLTALPKTSGSKGMQVYCPVRTGSAERTSEYAKDLAGRLERAMPDLVVARMAKNLRPRKVFIDWSQNNPKKTTVAPYSLRAQPRPTVSTPLFWDEVRACGEAEDLVFGPLDVLARVGSHGDLFDAVLTQDPPAL